MLFSPMLLASCEKGEVITGKLEVESRVNVGQLDEFMFDVIANEISRIAVSL